MNIPKIVEEWLKMKGYDGLYNIEEGCACDISSPFAFAPCGEPSYLCEPGYEAKCDEDCNHEDSDGSHIQKEKPVTEEALKGVENE